jgi:hypothetical protein
MKYCCIALALVLCGGCNNSIDISNQETDPQAQFDSYIPSSTIYGTIVNLPTKTIDTSTYYSDTSSLKNSLGGGFDRETMTSANQAVNCHKSKIYSSTHRIDSVFMTVKSVADIDSIVNRIYINKSPEIKSLVSKDCLLRKKLLSILLPIDSCFANVYVYHFDGYIATLDSANFSSNAQRYIDQSLIATFRNAYGNCFVNKSYLGALHIQAQKRSAKNIQGISSDALLKAMDIELRRTIGLSVNQDLWNIAEQILIKCDDGYICDGSVSPIFRGERLTEPIQDFLVSLKDAKSTPFAEFEPLSISYLPYWQVPAAGYDESSTELFPMYRE